MHSEPERYDSDRRRLAAALRALRKAAAMTGVRAAEASGMSQPKISKLENGRLLPAREDVETLLALYGASSSEREELLELAAGLHTMVESNDALRRRGSAQKQDRIRRVESSATALRFFSPVMVPGLLQTAEYIRRVITLVLSGPEVARTTAAKQERQQALYDPGRRFAFVLTEAVLRWGFCPGDVMAAQLAHIASIATLTNVEVGVIPFSARPGDTPLHGYQIYDERMVTISLEHASVTVTEPRDVAVYLRMFQTMSEAAVFGAEARELLLSASREQAER
ncbi:helix-turn-helix transcriptional regulator [Streptomyces harbinensis]|uniref:helix-turn-helix domain-containing protein n=1 Tax=Streptomyces harbinensis TaxID=1176198 RepID=UPI00339ADC06